jgi:xylose isomerase
MEHDNLRRETQRQLVKSLIKDLDRALSLVRDAERHVEWGGREGYQRLVQDARNVLETVRNLKDNVIDADAWVTIHARAGELERVLSNLPA